VVHAIHATRASGEVNAEINEAVEVSVDLMSREGQPQYLRGGQEPLHLKSNVTRKLRRHGIANLASYGNP
jgi:hypothetical protein